MKTIDGNIPQSVMRERTDHGVNKYERSQESWDLLT